jgi:hypothetical protein
MMRCLFILDPLDSLNLATETESARGPAFGGPD